MSRYRSTLPQLDGGLFLTDGGIETTLIFHERLDLPCFAAFHLLRDTAGTMALLKYFRTYSALAQRFDTGLILESPTWRASSDWGGRLGYSREQLAEANRASIRLLDRVRDETEHSQPVVISGCVGPRGDGYVPSAVMTADEACGYHGDQAETLAGTAADMICAVTMNYVEEAVGVAMASRAAGMPVAIALTVETDGRLPTGQPLGEAIDQVDAVTGAYPSYYMINCAHPDHFSAVLDPGAAWTSRIRGLRANASRQSHAELNEAAELDMGDPAELGRLYAQLRTERLPAVNVVGGCCGTDHRHVECIAGALASFGQ